MHDGSEEAALLPRLYKEAMTPLSPDPLADVRFSAAQAFGGAAIQHWLGNLSYRDFCIIRSAYANARHTSKRLAATQSNVIQFP